jgi:hypothetical protein
VGQGVRVVQLLTKKCPYEAAGATSAGRRRADCPNPRADSLGEGHEELPGGGRENCPVVATTPARSWPPGRLLVLVKAVTLFATLSPVAVAKVLGMSSSKPAGWRFGANRDGTRRRRRRTAPPVTYATVPAIRDGADPKDSGCSLDHLRTTFQAPYLGAPVYGNVLASRSNCYSRPGGSR